MRNGSEYNVSGNVESTDSVYHGGCWYRLKNTKDHYKGPRFTRCHCHPINKIRFITTNKISRSAASTCMYYIYYSTVRHYYPHICLQSYITGRPSVAEKRETEVKKPHNWIVTPSTCTHTQVHPRVSIRSIWFSLVTDA